MPLSDWLQVLPQIRRVRKLFDGKFYLERYPDVRQAGMNPLLHYLRHGAAEGRKPHALFDPEYYLNCCPAARKSGNPLAHFIDTGGRLGNPHPLFDCRAYLAEHPELAARGTNPLLHYIEHAKAPRAKVDQPLPSVTMRAHLQILDVEVDVEFWEEDSSRMNFLAEPQQRPFFRAMRFDQLAAQIKP